MQFWDPGWQTIIDACISGLVDEEFDGIFLDKFEAYAAFESP